MRLTDLQKAKAEKVLLKIKCPICGSTNIRAMDDTTHVIGFASVGSDIDFTKVSYVNAICTNCEDCGYIMQFRLDTILGQLLSFYNPYLHRGQVYCAIDFFTQISFLNFLGYRLFETLLRQKSFSTYGLRNKKSVFLYGSVYNYRFIFVSLHRILTKEND